MSTDKPILLNATGAQLAVMVDGRSRLLPSVPEPRVLASPIVDQRSEEEFCLVERDGKDHILKLRVEGESTVEGVLGLPPALPNVVYLVSMETLRDFPHRTDFYVPKTFSFDWAAMLKAGKWDRKLAKASLRRGAKWDRRASKYHARKAKQWAKAFPVASITRSPNPTATESTPVLDYSHL